MGKLVVFVSDGLITNVVSDEDHEVVVIDNNIDGLDEDMITMIQGDEVYVYDGLTDCQVDQEFVDYVFKETERSDNE